VTFQRNGSSWSRAAFATVVGASAAIFGVSAPMAAQRVHPHKVQVPAPASATIIFRGTVVRQDSTTPAPYSSVELVEAHARHFSDDAGHFSFKVAAGRYHVLVRQLGFAARDTVVDISERSPPAALVVVMNAITIRLSDVTVRAPQICTTPGVDSNATPILGEFMADVRQNADRELLLRRSYPFEYTVEDVQTSTPIGFTDSARSVVDTLGYRSDELMPYGRGKTVFTDRTDPRGAWERMRLPSTLDFADSTFLATHCFDYGVAPSGNYDINFRPLATITAPDVEGTVTLDSLTFVVRNSIIRLTNAGAVAPGYGHLEVRTTYREVLPRIALPDTISSTQRYSTPAPDSRSFVATEIQAMRTLRFIGRAPNGVSRQQLFGVPEKAGAALSTSVHNSTQ
jgi:hypothetical protein